MLNVFKQKGEQESTQDFLTEGLEYIVIIGFVVIFWPGSCNGPVE
jgi:hypothetical protein